jgi:YggT family protein
VLTAFLLTFVRFLAIALELLVLVRVLLSWVDPSASNPLARFVVDTTEPILSPVRRALPRTGMLDLSPLIVLFLLGAVLRWTV